MTVHDKGPHLLWVRRNNHVFFRTVMSFFWASANQSLQSFQYEEMLHGVKVSSFVPQQYTLLISTISKSNRSACYYLFSDASVIVYIQPAGLAFEERSAAFYLPFIYPSHCLPHVSLHLPV